MLPPKVAGVVNMEKQKQSLYFPEDTLREIAKEANRLDRSLSWTVQQAWRLAREEIKKFPKASWPGDGRASTAQAAVRQAPAVPVRRADDGEPKRASAQVLEFLKGKFDRELSG
jgi:uncharacterized small protein (TIGR04563 family)